MFLREQGFPYNALPHSLACVDVHFAFQMDPEAKQKDRALSHPSTPRFFTFSENLYEPDSLHYTKTQDKQGGDKQSGSFTEKFHQYSEQQVIYTKKIGQEGKTSK